MSGVSVDIDLKFPDALPDALKLAQAALTERVYYDSQENVPVRTGALKEASSFTDDSMTWSKEYASYVYFGNGRMAPRPWAEQAKSEHYEEWCQWAADVLEGSL